MVQPRFPRLGVRACKSRGRQKRGATYLWKQRLDSPFAASDVKLYRDIRKSRVKRGGSGGRGRKGNRERGSSITRCHPLLLAVIGDRALTFRGSAVVKWDCLACAFYFWKGRFATGNFFGWGWARRGGWWADKLLRWIITLCGLNLLLYLCGCTYVRDSFIVKNMGEIVNRMSWRGCTTLERKQSSCL